MKVRYKGITYRSGKKINFLEKGRYIPGFYFNKFTSKDSERTFSYFINISQDFLDSTRAQIQFIVLNDSYYNHNSFDDGLAVYLNEEHTYGNRNEYFEAVKFTDILKKL